MPSPSPSLTNGILVEPFNVCCCYSTLWFHILRYVIELFYVLCQSVLVKCYGAFNRICASNMMEFQLWILLYCGTLWSIGNNLLEQFLDSRSTYLVKVIVYKHQGLQTLEKRVLIYFFYRSKMANNLMFSFKS